jgi:pimeloyl-ACP methyl ester carboxylesterase
MKTLSQSQYPHPNSAEFSIPDNCSPASVQRRLIRRSNEVVIEYYAQGSGPVMVLLPSLGRGATDMLELALPLCAAGWRVLRPEPRGNGGSVGSLEGKTLHDWAGDIASVIEDDEAAPVWVLGHAHGNWIARTLASDRPDLVRGLILLAGSAGKVPRGVDAVPIPPAVRAAIERCAEPDLPDAERLVHLQHAFFAPGNDASVWLTGWNRHLMAMQTAAQKRTPVDDFFAGGQAPILNVQASHDVVAPPCYANVLKEYLGDRVTNRSIDNAGHALIPEQLDAVVDAILGYVAVDVSSGQAGRV